LSFSAACEVVPLQNVNLVRGSLALAMADDSLAGVPASIYCHAAECRTQHRARMMGGRAFGALPGDLSAMKAVYLRRQGMACHFIFDEVFLSN
jgi:hypothetical protein